MNNHLPHPPAFLRPARTGLASVLAALVSVALAPPLAGQTSDFNAGNDNGWTKYTLPYYGQATYSYPDDGQGGKAYRIYAPPTGDDPYQMGNARAGSFRADAAYAGRFSVGTDLLAWNADWEQEAGLLFYFQDINFGTSDGYTATYSSGYRNLYISQINNELPTTVAELGTGSVVLDPAHRYRLVASSHDGFTFLLQLFDLAEPNNPWQSAIGSDYLYNAGLCGYLVFEQKYKSSTEGADATFDNFRAFVPAAGTMPTTVTDLDPPPAGKATALYPTVTVKILDRDTLVNLDSIKLSLDGVWIPKESLGIEGLVHKPKNPSGLTDFYGATVTYPIPTLYPWGSRHTNVVQFADSSGASQTNTWTWTTAFPYLQASNSLPVGSLSVRGFDVRMAQSDNGGVNLDNSLARALQQLAVPPAIPVDRSATSIVQVLNWNKNGTPNPIPGLCPGNPINIAIESMAYLELKAGVHRFHIQSDDRAGLYSGAGLRDPHPLVLWENPSSTANATFEFVVEADGLYPVRCLWEETGGSGNLYLYSVNPDDFSDVVINDPTEPAGVVKAWYPMLCRSAESAGGPYTVDPAAKNVLATTDIVGADCSPTVVAQMPTGGTFTVPVSPATRFYCIDGPRKTRITGFRIDGSNAVITYQVP